MPAVELTDLDIRKAKVCNLGVPVGIQQDVGGLEVTVDDVWVQVRQSLCHVADDLQRMTAWRSVASCAGVQGS